MHVLHFFRTYLPETVGGVESSIYTLCRAGAEIGIENKVLTVSAHGASDVIQFPGHEVHRVPSRLTIASVQFSIRAIAKFRAMAQAADIVHYHFPWPMADVVQMVSSVRRPSVLTYHADIKRQPNLLRVYRPLMHWFLNSVDSIVATSENYVQTSPVLRQFRDKVDVVPLGICPEYSSPPERELVELWRSRFPGPFFLFVGMLRHYKGLLTLLAAAKLTGYPVVIVGEGTEQETLRARVASDDLSNVHLLGRVDDQSKAALLQLCRALVLPSDSSAEAFGIVLLEASVAGKPMITCEIGTGTSYVNLNGATGLVVSPKDPAALAEAMNSFWNNPIAAERMGKVAALRANTLFNGHHMATEYRRIYEKVITKQTSVAALQNSSDDLAPAARSQVSSN